MKENFYKNRGTVDGFEDYFEEMITMFLTSPTMKLNELSSIESEVLIIAGDREIIDIAHTISIFQTIKGSHLFIVPDAGHSVVFKKPALINSVMSDFLIPKQ